MTTKKIFLTSTIAMCMIAPSMAAPSNTGTFPTDGKMQADYTYTNAATSTNMAGVYEGSVNANAQYTINNYNVLAGTYLPADSEATATCTAGNFCPGLQSPVTYNATTNQGLESCPTGYGNSVAGASANTDCYRACSNSDVAHASSVSGEYYYGDNNQCSATACETGWHVNTSNLEAQAFAAINASGSFEETGENGQSHYGINAPMEFAIDYGNAGMLTGQARCSTQSGTNNDGTWSDPTIVSNLTDETGQSGAQYCYCKTTGYTTPGGNQQSLTNPWVFLIELGDDCPGICSSYCVYVSTMDSNFQTAMGNPLIGGATCDINYYTVNAGTYLPAGTESATTCTAGNFCPGLGNQVTYNATTNQGINACPSGYTSSATGATANTECYRTCAIANNGTTFTNIAHATAVSGNDYYNTTATDTCEPTACENGWHLRTMTSSELQTTIGSVEGTSYAYVDSGGSFFESGANHGKNYYGTTENDTWAVAYSNLGMLTGKAQCSTFAGSGAKSTTANLPDATGQHCWCQMASYTPMGETRRNLSALWVNMETESSANACGYHCAQKCARIAKDTHYTVADLHAAIFGSVQSSTTEFCEANEITITWSDAAQTDIDANNAGSVTYGGNINTPVKAQTKKGKTFRGWIFSTTGPAQE